MNEEETLAEFILNCLVVFWFNKQFPFGSRSHILWQRFEYICKLFLVPFLPDHKAQIILVLRRRHLKSGCRSHHNG